jgi:hypothetical protein
MNTISLSDINKVFSSKEEIYNSLSKIYYLPAFNSKAINMQYIQQILTNNPEKPQILLIKRAGLKFSPVPKLNSQLPIFELVEILSQFVIKNKLPSLCMGYNSLPDLEWILRVFCHLDSQDSSSIFSKPNTLQEIIQLTINPEYKFFKLSLIFFFSFF